MADASLELQRERVIQALIAQFARDTLTVDDLDARLEHAQAASSPIELHALVADLPALPPDHVATPIPAPVYSLAAPREGEGTQHIRCIFGEVRRTGQWVVPEALESTTFMGGTLLDLTQARLQPGLTTIDARVWFGELKVIVPPGVRVESQGGLALFGAFDHKETPTDALPADAPVVRITGMAAFGAVTIRTRFPRLKGGATNWLKGLFDE
ncbi:MAG: DUF1707 and DUF2154 domain-containing protein [Gemmatimonadetes bacterium]|nr:DUF1707 and DUF2154 domain-containing protein [Gemmatimonadota bacterium]